MTYPLPSEIISSLTIEAAAGQLCFADDLSSACIAACDDLLGRLDQIRYFADRLSTTSAYGTLASAQQLGTKFETKATGANGLRDVLQHHIDTVTQLRDLFDKAGRAYREADAAAAQLINETG